jgi:hypothetical protein
LDQLNPPVAVPPGNRDAGDVSDATGGSKDFPGVSADGTPKDCSNGFGSSEKWALVWAPVK